MIHAVLIFNTSGKPRLTKFYSPSSPQTRASILSRIFNLVSPRDDTLCNFVELPRGFGFFKDQTRDSEPALGGGLGDGEDDEDEELRVIYRHYATLYFAFVVDQSESELGILDLIQVFVESLDRCFENVCELDLIFHFDDVHTLLNCIITGGLVLDTSLESIQQSFRLQKQAKKQSENAGGVGSGFSAITNGLSLPTSSGVSLGGGGGGILGGGAEGAWERISSSLGSFSRR
ncbi:Aps3p [Sporobolomyces salmoneus]|uniref:Aps3p n=1 Tax=Sporobolomyces salmoneus TaxID=183962 RepID=UPI003179E5C4